MLSTFVACAENIFWFDPLNKLAVIFLRGKSGINQWA